MASVTKPAKGFDVFCPMCGDRDSSITLDVNDVHKLTCIACDAEFTAAAAVARVADQLARWQALARWIDAAAEFAAPK